MTLHLSDEGKFRREKNEPWVFTEFSGVVPTSVHVACLGEDLFLSASVFFARFVLDRVRVCVRVYVRRLPGYVRHAFCFCFVGSWILTATLAFRE